MVILYVIIKTEKNPKRIFKTRRYHRVHLKQVRRTIYLRERNKSRFLAAEEIPKPLIKRVDGFKLLIRKFASCAPHSAGRNTPVVLLRGKHSPEEHTTGKVTGNSDGVRAEARAEKGAAIGVGGGYRSRNICMEISCGGETLPIIFLPATGNFGSIHSSRISLGTTVLVSVTVNRTREIKIAVLSEKWKTTSLRHILVILILQY